MSEKIIDVEPVKEPQQTQALQVRETGGAVGQALPPEQIHAPITAAQAKVNAIADLTMSAYQKAATLNITPEEVAKLSADFPDEAFKPGAAGKEHLIYIEHAYLRGRLNEVFGMGQWALIPRNRWAEEFTTAKGVPGTKVYVEAMLVVRGCFVGEAVGSMDYYPSNGQQDYSDAVEGSKTAAFRRCAKEFGIGLQAWKKDWCEGWWQRKRGQSNVNAKVSYTRPTSQKPPGEAGPSDPQRPAPSPAQTSPAREPVKLYPTEEVKAKMIQVLEAGPARPNRTIVTEYFQKAGILMPNEEIEDIPLEWVPCSKGQMQALNRKISDFANGGEAERAFPQNDLPDAPKKAKTKTVEVPRDPDAFANSDDPDHPEAEWRVFPMPFGKNAGVCLADLEKNYLFGLWANFKVETEFNGKPKKPETIERDQEFRNMLDMAGEHYEFKTKD